MMVSTRTLLFRGLVLFFVGVFFTLVLHVLQAQRQMTVLPPAVFASMCSSIWWLAPMCGSAAGEFYYDY